MLTSAGPMRSEYETKKAAKAVEPSTLPVEYADMLQKAY
jgi:hypothetical protein